MSSENQLQKIILDWYRGVQNHIFNDADLGDLKKILNFSPDQITDLPSVTNAYFQVKEHSIYRADWTDLFQKALNRYQKDLRICLPSLQENKKSDDLLGQIQSNGFAKIMDLTEEQITSLQSGLDKQLADEIPEIKNSTLAKLITENVHWFRQQPLLKIPELFEIANNPFILNLVTQYLGAIPSILSYISWISIAGRSQAKDAQLFHYDHVDFKFIKLFIYLTDVDENGGPHTFIPGTHNMFHIMKEREAYQGDKADFDQWYFKKLRKTDEEINHYIQTKPVKLTGKAGTVLLADVSGLHKGLLPITHNRHLVQVTYGLSPQLESIPVLMPLTQSAIATKREYHQEPYKYINRFFMDFES